MKTDISSLFSRVQSKKGSYDLTDELKKIKKGKKAMSVFLYPRKSIDRSNYKELKNQALELDLLFIEQIENINRDDDRLTQSRIFVTTWNEMWRIPAYNLTRKIMHQYAWSDGAECLESCLLGYTESETQNWLKEIKKTRISWDGITVYFFIEKNRVKLLSDLGLKALTKDCIDIDISIFLPINAVLGDDALLKIDINEVLCRCALDQSYCEKLLDSKTNYNNRILTKIIIPVEKIPEFNKALRSDIYILTDKGWS